MQNKDRQDKTEKSMPKSYAAAQVTLLDRDTEKESGFYCYPITEVVLVSLDMKVSRRFVPDENGEWREMKGSEIA